MKMKTLAALALVVVSTGAMAAEDAHPFYVRGQVGAGRQLIDNKVLVAATDGSDEYDFKGSKQTKLAGRIAGGYKINDTFSAELGYTQFSQAPGSIVMVAPNGNTQKFAKVKSDAHAIDVLAKASYPINEQIAVFGGVGAAYYTAKSTVTQNSGAHYTNSTSALRPEFTVGSSYKINENIALDASFTQIVGKGSINGLNAAKSNYLPDAQLLAVGATYSF